MLQRRRSVPHILHSNSANQVSTAKFKTLCRHLLDNEYQVRAKVDGAHVKIGKTETGEVFFSSARSTTPFFKTDKTPHTNFSNTARSAAYDSIMHQVFECEFVDQIPCNTVVHFEMLHPLLGTDCGDKISFVTLEYPKTELGEKFTLVPLRAVRYSDGVQVETPALFDTSVKIVNNTVDIEISVPETLQRYITSGFDKSLEHSARIGLQSELTKLCNNLQFLGQTPEGIVVETPTVNVKVVSPVFRHLRTLPKNRTAVVAIGSLVGHKGHQELWESALQYATMHSADPYLFVSNTVGVDDPIPVDIKLKNWKEMYPEHSARITTITVNGGTLFSKIKHELIAPVPGLPPKYDTVVIFVGSDRRNITIPAALMKSVNKFTGYEHVKVELVASERTTGITFSHLRNLARTSDNVFDSWRTAFSSKISDDTIIEMIRCCKTLNKVQSD